MSCALVPLYTGLHNIPVGSAQTSYNLTQGHDPQRPPTRINVPLDISCRCRGGGVLDTPVWLTGLDGCNTERQLGRTKGQAQRTNPRQPHTMVAQV
jgi:hypothetical protein